MEQHNNEKPNQIIIIINNKELPKCLLLLKLIDYISIIAAIHETTGRSRLFF